MTEMYCGSGKRIVDLPESAWNDDILRRNGTKIVPCENCKHQGHLVRMQTISQSVSDAKLLGQNIQKDLAHTVSVITSGAYEGKVLCTCNCTTHYL